MTQFFLLITLNLKISELYKYKSCRMSKQLYNLKANLQVPKPLVIEQVLDVRWKL